MDPTQDNRPLALYTVLPPDTLLLRSIKGEEALSRLYCYALDVLTTAPVDIDALLGTPAAVRITRQDESGTPRWVSGHIASCSFIEMKGSYLRYALELVPWTWFLQRRVNCRIFQDNMTVPDIVKTIFRDAGFTDFRDELTEEYAGWEYCCQYQESDFHFVQRLMEQEGIYYYFEHEQNRQRLVLCDNQAEQPALPEAASLLFNRQSTADHNEDPTRFITEWTTQRKVVPGAMTLKDFDFTKPDAPLLARVNFPNQHAHADLEVYEYPGEYVAQRTGETLASRRLEEQNVEHEQFTGRTENRAVLCGSVFHLEDHPVDPFNERYRVLSATIDARNDDYESVEDDTDHTAYFRCDIEALRAETIYRPPRITKRPVIAGAQTAVVTGKPGDEIYTDEYGRVKVRFHWDRGDYPDETASCWIRAAQVWAGKQWGAMYIPRVGHEVIVEFLEGDPDRPIITGRVYNGANRPPYNLPDEKTKSTIKSNSSIGGGGFNELRFEDKKGEEELYIQAEKDENHLVKNDRSRTVGNDEIVEIGRNKDHVVVGKHLMQADEMILDAASKITIRCGGSTIVLTPAEITINSPMVKINC